MILSAINIIFALVFIAIPVFALIYLAKKHVPFGKPLLLGSVTMMIGYFGSSFIVLLINAIVEASGGAAFIETDMAYFYLAVTIATVLAVLMTIMLAKPLNGRRSAEETVAFGMGVVIPMVAYRAIGVIWTSIAYIETGADYAASGVLLTNGMFTMAVCFVDAFIAVMLADFINKGRLWTGFAFALTAELLINGAGSVYDAFAWPFIIYPITAVVLSAVMIAYDLRVWKDFPEPVSDKKVRRGKQNIQWPDPGDDGR